MPVDGRGHVTDLPGQPVALVARGLSLRVHVGDALVQGGLVGIHLLRQFATGGLDLIRFCIHGGDTGFERRRLRFKVILRFVSLRVNLGDGRIRGLLVRVHLCLKVGAHLVGLIASRLRLFARVIDTRLRILPDLLALLDSLIRLRGGIIGGLLQLFRGFSDLILVDRLVDCDDQMVGLIRHVRRGISLQVVRVVSRDGPQFHDATDRQTAGSELSRRAHASDVQHISAVRLGEDLDMVEVIDHAILERAVPMDEGDLHGAGRAQSGRT